MPCCSAGRSRCSSCSCSSGEWRTTAAAALSLPLTVAITLLGLALAGDSLNLMSLGGLAVAIGIIIDDAVVVVENIERRLALHPDQPPAEVVRSGTDEIFGPVAGSTLTTVVVFAPLGLLTGVVGEFFRSFAIALAVAVLLSLVLAMTLIPAIVAQWASRPESRHPRRGGTAAVPRLSLQASSNGTAARSAGCSRTGRRGWRRRPDSLLVALGLTRVIGTGFLPEMDEGGFILDYWAPPGAALSETDRQVRCSSASCWPIRRCRRSPAGRAASSASPPPRPTAVTSPCCSSRAASGRRCTR